MMTTKTDHASGGKATGPADEAVVRALLHRQRRTYAAQAGIRLRDTPAPLY